MPHIAEPHHYASAIALVARLAIRLLDRDGHYGIFFASWQVASIDLTNDQPVSDVSEQVSAMSPD